MKARVCINITYKWHTHGSKFVSGRAHTGIKVVSASQHKVTSFRHALLFLKAKESIVCACANTMGWVNFNPIVVPWATPTVAGMAAADTMELKRW